MQTLDEIFRFAFAYLLTWVEKQSLFVSTRKSDTENKNERDRTDDCSGSRTWAVQQRYNLTSLAF